MNPEYLEELIPSEETEEVSYGFCIPLKDGGFAWLRGVSQDTYIEKSDDGVWYSNDFPFTERGKRMKTYLDEIKSGEGNWIISPQNDNSDLKWCELDYEKSMLVKRVSKVTYEYSYYESVGGQ